MNHKIVWGVPLAGAMVAFAGSAFGGESSPGAGYSLTAKYHAGEIHHYSIITAISGYTGAGKAIPIQFDMKMHVLHVNGANSTIRVAAGTPTSGKFKLPSPFKTSTVVLDASNRPVGSSTSGQIFAALPTHPVRIGDHWTGSSTLMLSPKSGAMVATSYKLSAIKTFKGRQIAEVAMVLTGIAWGEGTELIDLADGSLLASEMNLHVDTKSKIPVQISLKRQS